MSHPAVCQKDLFIQLLKKEIAESIKYKITQGVGGPAEDAKILWILPLKYKGLWFEDALTIYQEERDINLRKTIDTNIAHLQTLNELKREGVFKSGNTYYLTAGKYLIKIFILSIMWIYPKIYLISLDLRDYGRLKTGWQLSPEKIDFIKNNMRTE